MIAAFFVIVVLVVAAAYWQRLLAACDQFSREAQAQREARFLAKNLPRSPEDTQ